MPTTTEFLTQTLAADPNIDPSFREALQKGGAPDAPKFSPAIGEFAVQECERLRAQNAELVAALRAVVGWRDGDEGPETLFNEGAKMINQARAAIARAEGR